jgi:glutamate formiminotransferase
MGCETCPETDYTFPICYTTKEEALEQAIIEVIKSAIRHSSGCTDCVDAMMQWIKKIVKEMNAVEDIEQRFNLVTDSLERLNERYTVQPVYMESEAARARRRETFANISNGNINF